MVTSESGRRLARPVVAALVGLGALVLVVPPAQAHTDLTNGTPGPGSSLRAAPESVRLVFTEPVSADLATVVVRAPNGDNLAEDPAWGTDATVVQPLEASTESGRFEVAYRVISVDGHPVSGSYTFRVRRTAPEATPTESAPATPTESAPSSPATGAAVTDPPTGEPRTGSGDALSASSIGLVGGAGLVAVVVAVGAALARRRTRGTHTGTPGP